LAATPHCPLSLHDALPISPEALEVVQILLVDDQPANLEALQASLQSAGCTFVSARSADEALLALLDQDFAAIVLDVRMPGMTGLDRKSTRLNSSHVAISYA